MVGCTEKIHVLWRGKCTHCGRSGCKKATCDIKNTPAHLLTAAQKKMVSDNQKKMAAAQKARSTFIEAAHKRLGHL